MRTPGMVRNLTSHELREPHRVTEDVTCIPLSIVNAYLIGSPGATDGSWILVDAGLYLSAKNILAAVERQFGPNARPAGIVLTHGHFDHIGALKHLAELWDVPIYAHPLEFPYLNGRSSYPPPDPMVGGGAMALMSPLYPRGPINVASRLRPLPDDGSLPGVLGWRWIHTPGHTPGHVSLFRDSDRCLIAGDAFVTTRQESLYGAVSQPEEIHGPPAYYTPDWERAWHSVERLAALDPEMVATGHGRPMYGPLMRQDLQFLARNFNCVAIPHRGRYVGRPALANEQGVISVPPMQVNPTLLVLGGLGVGLAAGLAASAATRKRRR